MAKKKQEVGPPQRKTCVLCGKRFPFGDPSCVVGSTGRMVCSKCLDVSQKLLQQPKVPQADKPDQQILLPQDMLQQLDQFIIGQEQAKQAVAIALWKQQLRASGESDVPKSHLLLYGPTGCGKTALVQEAARISDLPFISFDATTLSETGYRGRDAQDMIKDLVRRFKGHPKLAHGVIFLDEFDKLAARGSESRVAYNQGTQHSLLKLLEGAEVDCDLEAPFSTGNLLFIFGGVFTGLTGESTLSPARLIGFDRPYSTPPKKKIFSSSDFAAYGMERELLGRVGQYIPLKSLSKEDMKRILLDSKLSVFRKYQRFFLNHGVNLQISKRYTDDLIEQALTQGTGARGLNALVEESMQPLLFRLAAKGLCHKLILEPKEDLYA